MSNPRFYAKKVSVGNIVFDSQMEADYYLLLLEEERKGEISGLEIHKSFLLQEGFIGENGKKEKPITYEADFVYLKKGERRKVVVDVKGFITEDFALKRKMFDYLYTYKNKGEYTPLIILKYSKTTGFVPYGDYKKIKASARKKLIDEKNGYKKKLESLKTYQRLKEKEKIKRLTELETKKLENLKNELGVYLNGKEEI